MHTVGKLLSYHSSPNVFVGMVAPYHCLYAKRRTLSHFTPPRRARLGLALAPLNEI